MLASPPRQRIHGVRGSTKANAGCLGSKIRVDSKEQIRDNQFNEQEQEIMSDLKKDGGPAFPKIKRICDTSKPNGHNWMQVDSTDGKSLRDWFAGIALQGELASSGNPESAQATAEASVNAGETVEKHLARICYEMADAMLAEREK